ncbi:hypothetical protein BDV12DRAFT_204588 [Aspergillus spectabilis]
MRRQRRPLALLQVLTFLLIYLLPDVVAQQDATCSTEHSCRVGCCSKSGSCGFGPDWCDEDNCLSNCDAVAECGEYGGGKECPLNVCCSRWGFCGTTEEFCAETNDPDTTCQSNCGQPERETCANSGTWIQRRIAYYETWAETRYCDKFRPEDIPVKALTHLNIAFAGIESSMLAIEDSEMIRRIVKLKRRNRSLQVFIAVGGWAFSDPGPTRTAWSDMARTDEGRHLFINSLIFAMLQYNLDGVDLDWEYPVADDRSGRPQDFENYVTLVREMRERFDEYNRGWGISMAIPASYWYLQHFDVSELQKHVSWFNLMSYDMRGRWDMENEWTGPYVFGHTNITEIERGVDLLRRNSINLRNVNLGMGFHGRTFTLQDPGCSRPGCIFTDAGLEGECSGEEGILTFNEIMARLHRLNDVELRYDEASGVRYLVYDETQWITYDDEVSFARKRQMLDEGCYGGVMIWVIDQDTPDFQALSALLGEEFVSGGLIEGGELTDEEKEDIVDGMSGLTGDKCYVTSGCVGLHGDKAECEPGDIAVSYVHVPDRWAIRGGTNLACSPFTFHRVCCPSEAPAVNCEWVGMPEDGSRKCTGGQGDLTCGPLQYELVADYYTNPLGLALCSSGKTSLCCDAAEELRDCKWSECGTPYECETSYPIAKAARGDHCGNREAQTYCCKSDARLGDCEWAPKVNKEPGSLASPNYLRSHECAEDNWSCPPTRFTAGKAMIPERTGSYPPPCEYYVRTLQHRLCCEPHWDTDLPFDLDKIFPEPFEEDVLYRYSDNHGNNDRDPYGPDETDVGDDPYGFIVLDGEEDALLTEFHRNFIFTHVNDGTDRPIERRDTLTRDDPNITDWVFEHEESYHLIYCRTGQEAHCEKVFNGGAPDTIITLPRHIGSGRNAPRKAITPVYNLTIDYRFELIRREDALVNIRIDYTNLVPYWDEMTGDKSDDGAARSKRALRRHEKRWWGPYPEWLRKLTTVRTSDQGKLPLSIHKRMLLYSKRAECPRDNLLLKAGLDVTLDARFDMNARWAYYAQGTLVPLGIDTIYTYFELEPEVEAKIEVQGSAEMEYRSQRIKIIDTLSYPGLAIKGIAAVGPTLDLYGQMGAQARVAGTLTAGAKVTFPRYEMYFPQTPEAEEYQRWSLPAPENEQRITGPEMRPILDASVQARANLDFNITPEVNLGIRVNSPLGKEASLMDAQIVGFVNNTLRFEVEGQAKGGIGNPPAASYTVQIKYLYNFGIGGRAIFKWLGEHALDPRTLWPRPREKVLWEYHGSTSPSKRSPSELEDGRDEPLLSNYSLPTEQEWFGPADNLMHRSLERRSTLADIASFGNKSRLFTCNDGGQCSDGGCAGSSCEWNPAQSALSARQNTGGSSGTSPPAGVNPTQSCVNSIPAFMYNCKFFPDHYINGRHVPGICHNVLKAFELNGAGVGPLTGTYKMRGRSQKDTNRKWACEGWSGHEFKVTDEHGVEHRYDDTWVERCSLESAVLGRMTGLGSGPNGNSNWLSCDEFPFNAWDEGGLKIPNSRSCVPGYQQDLQGLANGLHHSLEQKVTWVDSTGQTVTSRDYKDWHADWLGASAVGPLARPVNRDTAWNHARNNRKSLSMHLFNSDSDDTVLGTKYQVFNHKIIAGPGTTETDIGLVMAAINTMDNPKYRFKGSGMNAYCHRPAFGSKLHQYWGTADGQNIRVRKCLVKFDNTAATTKMKRGEQPTVQEMFNITSIEFDDDDLDIDIPLPADMAEQLFAEENLAEHGHHDAPHVRGHVGAGRKHH